MMPKEFKTPFRLVKYTCDCGAKYYMRKGFKVYSKCYICKEVKILNWR